MDIAAFRTHLLNCFYPGAVPPAYPLSAADWGAVLRLADERYRRWEWNYGHSPDFNIEKRQRFPGGEIDARLDVHQGTIQTVKFYGDFFAEAETVAVEQMLVGVRYTRTDIRLALQDLAIERYFSGLDLETFVAFVC